MTFDFQMRHSFLAYFTVVLIAYNVFRFFSASDIKTAFLRVSFAQQNILLSENKILFTQGKVVLIL